MAEQQHACPLHCPAGVGNAPPPKKDLHRLVKWPKYVRIQRQRRVLNQRLKVSRLHPGGCQAGSHQAWPRYARCTVGSSPAVSSLLGPVSFQSCRPINCKQLCLRMGQCAGRLRVARLRLWLNASSQGLKRDANGCTGPESVPVSCLLQVPPALNRFSKAMDKNSAATLFKLLLKYKPEDKAAKKERLMEEAQSRTGGKQVGSSRPCMPPPSALPAAPRHPRTPKTAGHSLGTGCPICPPTCTDILRIWVSAGRARCGRHARGTEC